MKNLICSLLLEGHGIDGLGDVPDVYPAVKDLIVAPSKGATFPEINPSLTCKKSSHAP